MKPGKKNAPPEQTGRGAEEAEQVEISEAQCDTHGPIIKRLIVGAALRGMLPAKLATWLINAFGLRGV